MAPSDNLKINKNSMALIGAACAIVVSSIGAYREIVLPLKDMKMDIAIVKNDISTIARTVDKLQVELATLALDNARLHTEVTNLKEKLSEGAKR